jgi:hypothetical protein
MTMKISMKPWLTMALGTVLGSLTVHAISQPDSSAPVATLLASELEGSFGSTVGPGGALYVTESAAGRISRVDPVTGAVTTFATGLPQTIPAVGIGGPVDVAFIGSTAYVLVTLVGTDVGGDDIVGIYRVDGPASVTPIADIGAFAINNPPETDFFVPSGVQYALEAYSGGFLVTDGHHNRMLRVTLDRHAGVESGEVSQLIAFDNIVPTGFALSGNEVFMAQAGPVPHLPEDGKAVSFGLHSLDVSSVASGARLLVDVEFGRGRTLFGLSQGLFPLGGDPGAPALPNTGALMRANADGIFTSIVDRLNLPTSLEIIGNTAYVITLTGEIWKIDGIAGPPYGSAK